MRDEANKRLFSRHSLRVPCSFKLDGKSESGFITNLSARGFFLQTMVKPPAYTELVITTTTVDLLEPVTLTGVVVRGLKSHRSTSAVTGHGLGVRLDSAPEAYYQAVLTLDSRAR